MWLTRNRLDVFLVSSLINFNEYYSLLLRLFLMTVINLSPPLKMQHGDKQMFKLEITIEEINVFIHLWVKRSIEVVLIPSLLTLNKLSKRINIGISLVSVFTKQLLRICLQISLLTLRKFKRIHYILFPQNHQKEIDFLMISAGIQVH